MPDDTATFKQLVVENRILGLQLRRVAERCERLEQELLLERLQSVVRMREMLRDARPVLAIRDEEGR